MVQKRVLVLDMDDTLCSFIGPVIEKSKRLFPDRQFKLPRYGQYGRWCTDNFSTEDMMLVQEHIFNDEFYLSLPPVLSTSHGPGLYDFSEVAWSKFDQIIIATARRGYMKHPEEVTSEWLTKNNFRDSDRLRIKVFDTKESKLSCVKGPALFVDDSLTLAQSIVSQGFGTESADHHMILVNQPWNDGFSRTNDCTITPVRRMIEALSVTADQLNYPFRK